MYIPTVGSCLQMEDSCLFVHLVRIEPAALVILGQVQMYLTQHTLTTSVTGVVQPVVLNPSGHLVLDTASTRNMTKPVLKNVVWVLEI